MDGAKFYQRPKTALQEKLSVQLISRLSTEKLNWTEIAILLSYIDKKKWDRKVRFKTIFVQHT